MFHKKSSMNIMDAIIRFFDGSLFLAGGTNMFRKRFCGVWIGCNSTNKMVLDWWNMYITLSYGMKGLENEDVCIIGIGYLIKG